jgi:hypothetical protein
MQDRVAVGDLGFRATSVLRGYETGILVDRAKAAPLWLPAESIRTATIESAHAGKVIGKPGILVVGWELPSGTVINTGFRADDKRIYPAWIEQFAPRQAVSAATQGAQNGEHA